MSLLPDDVVRSIRGRLALKRGERAEVSVARTLKGYGWSCTRTRTGPIDVIAAKEGVVLLIQVKSGNAKVRPGEAKAIVKWAENFNANAEIWYIRSRHWQKRRIFARRANVSTGK